MRKKQGYTPDASVAGDEVINGARPKPFMVYRNLDLMNVHPIQSVVKVDDTVSGVGEALEAGCWGVGIARYSNYMDMDTLEEAGSLPEEEIQRRLIKTRDILQKAGAHYVIDTFDQLVDVVDDINLRLSRGERPLKRICPYKMVKPSEQETASLETQGSLFLQVSYTQLRSFHAVAGTGGFTAASKVLHVGQPTITGQVRALEDYYGVELFHRRGRRVELTETGMELYAVTQRMEILEREAQDVLQTAGGFQSGHLRVGAVGPYHLTEMLAVFRERFPYLKITVTVRNSEDILENLLNFEVDVAVLSQTETDSRILAVPFCQEPLVVFVHSGHPWASRETLRIEELEGQDVILREPGSTTRRAFEKALKQTGVTIRPVMEIGSREAVWMAVARGLGIGVVSNLEFMPHPNLRKLSFENADVHTNAHVVCLRERRDSRIIHEFFQIVEELRQT